MVSLDLSSLRVAPTFRGVQLNTDPVTALYPDVATAMSRLLPPGLAWKWVKGGVGERLGTALAEEIAKTQLLIQKLLAEGDPQQTLELLEEWERMLALPAPAFANLVQDEVTRRAAIVDLLRGRQTATPAYLATIPSVFGYAADTILRRVARAGTWRAGEAVWGPQWQYWFGLNVHTTQSVAAVEALLATHVPAHVKAEVMQGDFDLCTMRLPPKFKGLDMNGPTQSAPPPPVDTDTGTAVIQLQVPTSVTATNACFKAYVSCPDYVPYVYFEYRQVGSTIWLNTSPMRQIRPRHKRYANYYELAQGLVPGGNYEVRCWISDPTGLLVNYSTNTVTPTKTFTTPGNVNDGSQWGTRSHTSGVTMPCWADPGNPLSGEVDLVTNPHVWTSNVQRAGGTNAYDVRYFGTDNPDGRTPGTMEIFHVVTADATTDLLTTAAWHFLTANTAFVLSSTGSLPTLATGAMVAGTTYYAAGPITQTGMKVALTSGGAAQDITNPGSGVITLKATKTYADHWFQNALTQHSVIGTVIYQQGFDGKRAVFNSTDQALLSAAGNLHIYDEANNSMWDCAIGGANGPTSISSKDAYWKVGATYVPIVGVSVIGEGTVNFGNSPLFTPGEPILYHSAGSLLGGCTNIWFRNLKLMSVTGNTSRIGGGQAYKTNAAAPSGDYLKSGTGQAIGLIGRVDCVKRAFREWPTNISNGNYSNENGYGTKTHDRWVGQFRLMEWNVTCSQTREHDIYTEAMSCARSGKGKTQLRTLRDMVGQTPNTLDPTLGFLRQALQFTTRANPDAMCDTTGCINTQLEYTGSKTPNYWDGPASHGELELIDVYLNGSTAGGGNGTEPYNCVGWHGPITLNDVRGGRGVGFSFLCDTGKGMYLREGADGFMYAHGPLKILLASAVATQAYSDGGLNLNSCESIVIAAFDYHVINRATINLYTAAGDGTQEGIPMGENGSLRIDAVPSGLAGYSGWSLIPLKYRTGTGTEKQYTPAQLEKLIAGIKRTDPGGFANP